MRLFQVQCIPCCPIPKEHSVIIQMQLLDAASTNKRQMRSLTTFRLSFAATAAKSLQLCPTLCDPIHGSPPGSAIPGILQARTLEWVAIAFPNAWTWKVKVMLLSCVRPSATPWTAAYQAPPSSSSSSILFNQLMVFPLLQLIYLYFL